MFLVVLGDEDEGRNVRTFPFIGFRVDIILSSRSGRQDGLKNKDLSLAL